MNKYIAIYVRRSVSDKEKGNNSLSIPAQIADCIKFVGEDTFYKVYEEDGKSGKDIKHRPAFRQMFEDCREGLVSKIVVKKYDRFSRNMREYLNITDELDKLGVSVVSLCEPFNTDTKEGRMMRNNLLNFAEFEREAIAARVKDSYDTKAQETGFYQGGVVYFGYQSSRQTINGKTGSVLVPYDSAVTVRAMFDVYANPEASLRDVILYINENNLPMDAPKGDGTVTRGFDAPNIAAVLKNPLYVRADKNVYEYLLKNNYRIIDDVDAFDGKHGLFWHNYRSKTDRYVKVGYHEGLVDADVWLAVQDKFSHHHIPLRKGKVLRSWMSGLLMEAYMQAEIADLRSQLEEARGKDGSKSFSVKEIEKTIARYEKKLKEGQDKVSKDDYIDFEEMGFDKLFVDECHLYKNLGTATKMSNVAGIGTTGSGKAAELLMKTRYFDELTGGKGMVFASGTPIITGYQRSKMPILRCLSIPPYILPPREYIRRYCFTAHFPLTIPQKPYIIVVTKQIQPEVQSNGRKDHNIYIRQKDLHSPHIEHTFYNDEKAGRICSPFGRERTQNKNVFSRVQRVLGDDFIRIHRGCLVSAKAIHSVNQLLTLSNGDSLEYSALHREEIIEKFHKKQRIIVEELMSSDNPMADDEYHEHYKCFDNIPVAFADIEMMFNEESQAVDWIFRYGNDALARLENCPLDKLIGSRFSSIFANMDSKWLRTYERAVLYGETLKLIDYSPEIDKYLRIICFPTFKGHCGCMLFDIDDTKIPFENAAGYRAVLMYLRKMMN